MEYRTDSIESIGELYRCLMKSLKRSALYTTLMKSYSTYLMKLPEIKSYWIVVHSAIVNNYLI